MIIHVDMDAYYASVEERDQPELVGRPLIVGGRPEGRGVVAAANYAARKFGVRSAMPTAKAIKLCPHLLIIPPRGDVYRQVSEQIHKIFSRYTPIIEPLSLDEAFLDPGGSEKLYGDAISIGKKIKCEIFDELHLVASVGVAPNKFLAKLASDQDKPDGFTIVTRDKVQEFLDPLPIFRMWGIGKAAQKQLQQLGITTIGNMRHTSESFLSQQFGKTGSRLWELCHGRDSRKVITESEAKSISRETTFDIDISSLDTLESFALTLTESVCFRLRKAELKVRTLHLKVRYQDFSTVTRSKTLPHLTSNTNEIWGVLQQLLRSLLKNKQFSVRLIGVGLSQFSHCDQTPRQQDLLEMTGTQNDGVRASEKSNKIDEVTDQIKNRFGKPAIKLGKSQ